jgi:hypothetical protein
MVREAYPDLLFPSDQSGWHGLGYARNATGLHAEFSLFDCRKPGKSADVYLWRHSRVGNARVSSVRRAKRLAAFTPSPLDSSLIRPPNLRVARDTTGGAHEGYFYRLTICQVAPGLLPRTVDSILVIYC